MAGVVESLTEAVERSMDDMSGAAANAKTALEDAESQARSFIRDYPLASLAAAVVAGYVVARLLPRV